MILKQVHRGIEFYQSTWMKLYIDKNTEFRKNAKNDFEKDFFKLMINSIFGKTIENIRKRQNVKLVDDEKKAFKISLKPNFDRATIFDENLVAIHMKKTEVYFNKPIFVGQAILDISKTHMFDFHYNYIKKNYGDKAELLMTDTDSLMYLIQTDDVFKDIKREDVKERFDTHNFPKHHPSGIQTGVNEKEVGIFKFEAGANIIIRFTGLCSKMYAYLIEMRFKENKKEKKIEEIELKEEEIRKSKGVKKNVIKNSLRLEDYKKCLFSEKKVMKNMNIIRSENHDIYSKTINKVALSANDDKRLVCKNKIYTLALRPDTNE